MIQSELDAYLASQKWTFAKTMAAIPHEWTARPKTSPGDIEFQSAVIALRQLGKPRKFGRREFIYYTANGFSHWTMGAPVGATTIINRCLANDSYTAEVASQYDAVFSSPEDRAIDDRIARMLNQHLIKNGSTSHQETKPVLSCAARMLTQNLSRVKR
jgi:hypothetical protein